LSKVYLLRAGQHRCDRSDVTVRNGPDSRRVEPSIKLESFMGNRLHFAAAVSLSLLGAIPAAFAQRGAAGAAQTQVAPGMGGVPPVGTTNPGSAGISSAPGGPSTTATGTTTGLNSGISQPGAPNISTPGTIGTGAAPSGLPGDDPTHPGFPGRVGR
jgi:hypothetical protein